MAGVQEFTKRLAEDKEFADSIAKAVSQEELLSNIKEAGYNVTEDELKKLAETVGALSDDELEKAIGAAGCDFTDLSRTVICPICGELVGNYILHLFTHADEECGKMAKVEEKVRR